MKTAIISVIGPGADCDFWVPQTMKFNFQAAVLELFTQKTQTSDTENTEIRRPFSVPSVGCDWLSVTSVRNAFKEMSRGSRNRHSSLSGGFAAAERR